MHLIAAALYFTLSAQLWRTRWRAPNVQALPASLDVRERVLLLAALALHGVSLRNDIFAGGTMHFSFAIALSFMMWLSIALYWIESFYARIEGLLAIGLPAAAIAALLPGIMTQHHGVIDADSFAFRLHLLVAMLAYSLFALAALHALLMSAMKKNLHRGQLSPLFAGLPPLLTMESLMFRVIHIAFVLLTLTLISGFIFSEDLFGTPLTLTHKTVFAILSWVIFAILLVGRHLRGWRGRTALLWTQTGFITLLLAYVGSYFVLDVILHRVG